MHEGSIRPGDVLTSIDGNTVLDFYDIDLLLGPVGSEALISVLRPDKTLPIEVQCKEDFEGPIRASIVRSNDYLKRQPKFASSSWPDPCQ